MQWPLKTWILFVKCSRFIRLMLPVWYKVWHEKTLCQPSCGTRMRYQGEMQVEMLCIKMNILYVLLLYFRIYWKQYQAFPHIKVWCMTDFCRNEWEEEGECRTVDDHTSWPTNVHLSLKRNKTIDLKRQEIWVYVLPFFSAPTTMLNWFTTILLSNWQNCFCKYVSCLISWFSVCVCVCVCARAVLLPWDADQGSLPDWHHSLMLFIP